MKPSLRALAACIFPIIVLGLLVGGCGPSPEAQATLTSTAQTATAAMWTNTFTPTDTFTNTYTSTLTFTSTYTSTQTLTPTITSTSTITPSPTFDFPKVSVNVPMAACLYGPAKSYLWKFDLSQGDKGFVGGRAPVGNWLYVKFDRWNDYCWVSPYVIDIVGDVKRVTVQQVRLPITNALYAAPTNIQSERNGDQVTITWDEVGMTEDDDRGYFLDVWVCQNGNFVWMPTSLPDQYSSTATFTDQPGCSYPSGGKLYTVEKHGYTNPVDIPWPK